MQRNWKKNDAEAFKWYKRAEKLGDPDAMCRLDTCYRNGEGVAQDAGKAVEYFRKAADCWYPEAVDLCKEMAEEGNAEAGNTDAKEALKFL